MARKKKCIAMLLAGGQGSRLAPLTENVAKPAVPFGGRYRIIDFSLSNCVNSNIDTVGVLTQYQPLELNDYLGTGDPWDLNLNYGGLHVLPPYQASKGGDCISDACALAYLARAIGYKKVYVAREAKRSSAHAWTEIDGKIYDAMFAPRDFDKYYGTSPKRSGHHAKDRSRVAVEYE